MITAGEIMSRDVVSVLPDMSVAETSDLLTRYRIHGAPVVDETGQLVGMVSLVDLVGRVGNTVADLMTPDPVSTSEDATVEEVAGMMLEQMVRRIPIIENGRVIGIVSASDIIRVFLNLHDAAGEQTPAREDRAPTVTRQSGPTPQVRAPRVRKLARLRQAKQ